MSTIVSTSAGITCGSVSDAGGVALLSLAGVDIVDVRFNTPYQVQLIQDLCFNFSSLLHHLSALRVCSIYRCTIIIHY